jgi:hypothetical protein
MGSTVRKAGWEMAQLQTFPVFLAVGHSAGDTALFQCKSDVGGLVFCIAILFFMFFSVHTCGVPTPLTDLATVWDKVAIQPHRLQAILSCTAIPGMVSVSRLKKWETTKITEANPRRYITKIITRLNVVGNKYVLHTVHPEWQCQVKM